MSNVIIKINCIYADRCWCKNKKVNRSLFGFGARVCIDHKNCKFKEQSPRPKKGPKGINGCK